MNPRICHHCKRPEDTKLDARGKVAVELRPYGPGGALVCFACGTKPENKGETERQFAARLHAAPIVVLTPEGPAPAMEYLLALHDSRRRS